MKGPVRGGPGSRILFEVDIVSDTFSDKHFEVGIVLFDDSPESTELLGHSPASVEHQLRQLPPAPLFIVVAALEGERNLGHFLLWSNGNRALIRMEGRREHLGTSPVPEHRDTTYVGFLNTDGTTLLQPFEQTVPYTTAMEALAYWLHTRRRAPSLAWH